MLLRHCCNIVHGRDLFFQLECLHHLGAPHTYVLSLFCRADRATDTGFLLFHLPLCGMGTLNFYNAIKCSHSLLSLFHPPRYFSLSLIFLVSFLSRENTPAKRIWEKKCVQESDNKRCNQPEKKKNRMESIIDKRERRRRKTFLLCVFSSSIHNTAGWQDSPKVSAFGERSIWRSWSSSYH